MDLDKAPTFLTSDQIASEVKRYSYRHGWKLSTFTDPVDGLCIYIVAEVENAFKRGDTTQLRIRSTFPPIPDSDYLGWWLLDRLIQIERHECCEFFRRDGGHLYDPHDPYEPLAEAIVK